MMPVINAVSVTTSDMNRTVSFYSALGFNFAGVDLSEDHVEAISPPGHVRLMIDSSELIASILGEAPRPATHSAFALLCANPTEVDAVTAKVAEAGFEVVKQPWDAFWGQRYAVVKDPSGYLVDLFSPL
jgi:catechol 2,3-dioxygenase-like lactoylglutathione lyase family enzyme